MFSCLILKRLAPLDMMDEPRVWRDKSWTDGSDANSNSTAAAFTVKQQGHLVAQSVTSPNALNIYLERALILSKQL